MPEITKEEQQILTNIEVKFRLVNHNGNTKEELTPVETKILSALRTEFDASPDRSSREAILETVQKATEEAGAEPVKKKSGFGKFLDKAKETVQENVRNVRVNTGAGSVNIPNVPNKGKQQQQTGNKVTADDIASIADEVYAAADAGKPKTLESLIQGADTNKDKVLQSSELGALLGNKDFVALTKGKEVAVVNNPRHDNDEIVIGGDKGKRINLSDLGVTITDGTPATGGFPAGKTTIQKGR